ncbi:cytochrome ubiquinol oxidase subunit I [Granulicoccus phenolivorans]|uniref:cytochrome ubiquinol oxidase subunit I n=1 Tax=Granulicoccus phenolivorans TaxID=266854 RepID=UPI00047D4C48|nr:cytochrome ubiquinol oxidase subunit I [Granulicoccus phenolivorans]
MDPVTLARWQFGITTVYHFFFVPITLSLSFIVAIFQSVWLRTRNLAYLRLTKFYGKLFLINFAMGVVTGIVQEFQFGMNWSDYSRFVGDIFGAPLALEALLAFFLESTFLGLWIFGWDRLKPKVHLATIWIVAVGTALSASFILAANAWMQNPVGFHIDQTQNRAELDSFLAVLTNPVFMATFPHTMTAAWLVGGGFVAGVAGWHLWRINRAGRLTEQAEDVNAFRWATKFGAWVLIFAGIGVSLSGDFQGKVMYQAQPMKMAAAEAAFTDGTEFSLLTICPVDKQSEEHCRAIKIPGLLSFLAHGNFTEPVPGIVTTQAEYERTMTPRLEQLYGPEVAQRVSRNFAPNIPVSYWTFRMMITLGMISVAIGVFMLLFLRKSKSGHQRLPRTRWWLAAFIALPLLPLFGNSMGWIFTEMGRQPWVVFGWMPTIAAVSPGVPAAQVLTSMIVFTLLYGSLAVVEVKLMLHYIRKGLPEDVQEPKVVEHDDEPLTFAY